MSNLLEDYESYLTTEKKASANTVSSYLRDVHQFAQEMEERDVPLDEVLPRDVVDYIRGLTRRGKSGSSPFTPPPSGRWRSICATSARSSSTSRTRRRCSST